MNFRRILGILLLIAGIACIFFAKYINSQVSEGKTKISKAQQQVDTGNSLFSLNPVTKELGKGLTGSAQKKIDEGQQTVNEYENLAHWLNTGGIVLIALGAVVFVLSFIGGKKTRR